MEIFAKFLFEAGYKNYALVLSVVLIFIELNPKIKWNPITAALSYIGKSFNHSVEKQISGFKEEVNMKFDALQAEQQAQRLSLNKMLADQHNRDIELLYWEIIDFENSIANGIKHSREQYRHILRAYKDYTKLLTAAQAKVEEDTIIKVQEAMDSIKVHYENGRSDQATLF